MNKEYCFRLFEVSTLPQWRLLGEQRGYSELMPDSGEYLCFREHYRVRNEVMQKDADCRACRGAYALMSSVERKAELDRLRALYEAHTYKMYIFSHACGYRLC